MSSRPPCNNFNCNSTAHESWKCPLPTVCRGCHASTHLWLQCPEHCINCGAPRHKNDYCYDFEPGTRYKPWNFPEDVPLGLMYCISYKTTHEAIMNGDNRFGPEDSQGGRLLVPGPMSSRNPNEVSQPAWALASSGKDTVKTGIARAPQLSHRDIQRLRAEANSYSLGNSSAVLPAQAPEDSTRSSKHNPPDDFTHGLPLMRQSNPSRSEKRTRVEDATQSTSNTERRRVVVENIPYAATPEDLNWFFSEFNVDYIALAARYAGHALVGFATAADADRAIQNLSGKTLHGSPISVQLEKHPANKGSCALLSHASLHSNSKKQQPDQGSSRCKRVKIQDKKSSNAVVQVAKEGREIPNLNSRQIPTQENSKGPVAGTILEIIETDKPLMADGSLIQFHIGNLGENFTRMKLIDLLKHVETNVYVSSENENLVMRDETLGYYIIVWIERKPSAKAAIELLSTQSFEGKELKVRRAERLVAAGRSGYSKSTEDFSESESYSVEQLEAIGQAGKCAIAEERRVRALNLNNDTDYFDLRVYFKDYAVTRLTMCFKPRVRRNEGYWAFVDFVNAAEAQRAISELPARQSRGDLVALDKRKKANQIGLKIEGKKKGKAKLLEEPSGRHFLRITDLPFEAKERDVRNLFADIQIKSITLPSFANTRCPAGYAIVELASIEHAQFARSNIPKRDFLGGHVRAVMEEDRPDIFTAPVMPEHLGERQGQDLKQIFAEAMLWVGNDQKDWNRSVLKEWWMKEKGIWLDL